MVSEVVTNPGEKRKRKESREQVSWKDNSQVEGGNEGGGR